MAQQSFIWYTGDMCGLTQTAKGLAVLPPSCINPFDFLLPDKTGRVVSDSNLTNRLYQTVDFGAEADFSRKIHIAKNEIGNISYYLNIDDFQMARTRCPFGFDPKVDDTTGVEADYATVELELNDDTEAFCGKVNDILIDNVLSQYARWFGSVPDFVNKKFLQEKKIFKNFFTPTNEKYRGLYTVKAYKTGHPLATDYWVYDSKTKGYTRGSHRDLQKQCEVVPVITVSKLHFKGSGNRYSRIGSTITLKRVLIYPPKKDVIHGMLLFKKRKTVAPAPSTTTDNSPTKRSRVEPTANAEEEAESEGVDTDADGEGVDDEEADDTGDYV